MDVDTLFLALVMSLSPLAVLASVLLLTTERGTAKAAAYAVGWVVAVGLIGVATIVVASQVSESSSGGSTASDVIDLALGLVLLVLALRRYRVGGSGAGEPGWMRRLDDMSPFVALGFGLFMPPYVVAAAGANDIVRSSGGSGGSSVVPAVLVFTLVASLGVLVPVAYAIGAPGSDEVIARWRAWLLRHWPALAVGLFTVVGAYLVLKGAVGLLS